MKRINKFMNHVSKYGIIIEFLGILMSKLFGKYKLMPLKITIDSLYVIGTLLTGYYIGLTVGKSKNSAI
ncbi:MAG: hypothetical protein PHX70_02765 [Clostridium sp.]|nr:hypothetical protein [Clostridium sp.]